LTLRRVDFRRPYNSEQEIPTLGELVGVSDVHILTISCVDGEEARAKLGALLKSLDPLTHAISIKEEEQRKLQTYLKSPANLHFVTDHLSPLDGEISNVLPTRAERHESGMLLGSCSETDYSHAGRLANGDDCAAQSQGPEHLNPGHPSEVESFLLTRKPILTTFRMITMRKASTVSNRARWIWAFWRADRRFCPIL
jgi:hypothetical protein